MMILFKNPFTNKMPYPQAQPYQITAPSGQYTGYGRAYSGNELVYRCIETLATSAGEPHIVGRRWTRNSPEIRNWVGSEQRRLEARGVALRDVYTRMITNGFYKDLPSHPLIRLLDNPNPWMSRGQQWGNVVMDRALAGNAYLLKARWQGGPLNGTVAELWRLRPDRVKIIPDPVNFIKAYEYGIGGRDTVMIPPEDVIHFKTRNPYDDYYGMPVIMAIAGRVDIDGYMKNFLRGFFERGGTGPGAILTVENKLEPEQKEEIAERHRRQFGPQGGFLDLMVLDNTKSTYEQMSLNRGLRDALPKELDAMSEARIVMPFGIPHSIANTLIGQESSSYANRRQDWQVFWKITMAPMLSDFDDVLNRDLVPEFGNIDEVLFNLADIEALQEDVDKLHERLRADLAAGGLGYKEFREAIGLDPNLTDDVLMVPRLSVPTPVEDLGKVLLPDAAERAPKVEVDDDPERVPEAQDLLPAQIVAEVHCPECGMWIGRNVNVGASVYCAKHKEVLVTP